MKNKLFILTIAFFFSISLSYLTKKSIFTAKAKSNLIISTQEGPIIPLAPVQVTNTADTGDGSLRAAINVANQTAGTTIQFNIPTNDPGFDGKVFTIKPTGAFPILNKDNTVIDGASNNTNPLGPEIVIDGSLAGGLADCFRISANSCTIRGLNIRNFAFGDGIQIQDGSRNANVVNCYIGTDETGTVMAGNRVGIRIAGGATGCAIGGSVATGNVISGNITDGLIITGVGSDNNNVSGNFIGVDASPNRNQLPNLGDGIKIIGSAKSNNIGMGTPDTSNIIAGNLGNGITISGNATNLNKISGNFIGVLSNNSARGNSQSGIFVTDNADTNTIGPGNSIAFNSRNGVTVGATSSANGVTKNKITRNPIFMNGGLGIDLGNDGPTNNDPGDGDNGPNALINYPVITGVTNNGNNSITVRGTVDIPNSTPAGTVVEIFVNQLPVPGGDPSGFGEGQTIVAMPVINSMGAFMATFTANPNSVISAVTVEPTGNTSEFAANFQLGGGQPDLQVLNLGATPDMVSTGDTVKVSFNIKNQGTSSASSNRQDIVISVDEMISSEDTLLASVTSPALDPQAAMSFTQNIMIPNNFAAGQFFIGVISDAGAMVTESNENNNTARVPITIATMPDLRISNLRATPINTSPGDTIRVEFTVTNQGNADAPTHVEEIRLSKDTTIGNADDVVLRTEQTTLLKPNASSRLSVDVRIPTATTPGTYNIGAIVDARNVVVETDETNNIAGTPLNISGSVDLDLINLSLSPNTGVAGTLVGVSFQLVNRGSINSPAVQVEIRFSDDQTITTLDPLLATISSNPINAGDTITLTANINIPAGVTSGRSFIGVVADPRDSINESNENNNIITAGFTIPDRTAPVVSVKSPNGSELATAGGTLPIQWTSTDDIGVVSQDIFLSTDGGATFNQVIVTGLAGTTNSFTWNVPSSLNTGTAKVQVVARDAAGNLGNDASDNNFIVGVRPVILGPTFKEGKLTFLVQNSNLPTSGSTLTVVNGASRESFAIGLNSDSSKFVVTKKSISTPGRISLKQAIPPGVPVMLIVTNPNGIASLPITFQR